jgi:hypothetical protein
MTQLKLIYILPSELFLLPLHAGGGLQYLLYVPRFYSVSVYQPFIDIPLYHRTNA